MSENNQRKIIVIGAGCIGIYIGTKLAKEGHSVSLFGRRKLESLGKTIEINSVIYQVPEKYIEAPKNQYFDCIFITTKLYHLMDALELLKKNNITGENVYSIQNGLVDENVYKGLLDGKNMTVISVFEGIQLNQQKITVSATGLGWKTEDSDEGRLAAQLLSQAGIPCVVDPHLLKVRAEKTIVNCCLNVLSAVYGKQFYELFLDQITSKKIRILFDECYSVFEAVVPLDPKSIVWKRLVDGWSTAHHFSSTYQDLVSGRETEIEFLTGYILSLSKVQHIAVPENERLYQEFLEKIRQRSI